MTTLFTIFRLDLPAAIKISESSNTPHSHQYEELIIGMEGEIEHFIDFKTTRLRAPFASFVTKGKVHRVVPRGINGKCDMWVIRFLSEFIPETTFQLYSYYHDHANIEMINTECFSRLTNLCEIMNGEAGQQTPDFSIIRHLLSALFTMVESERKKIKGEEITGTHQNIAFKNFLHILEENFRRPEGVDYYAEKLFMSSRNLNLICQAIMQKSVTELIETRKLIEAKNLLIHSEKNISEIAYELGYNEKSYFTSVFKKKSGITPTEFRDEMRKLVS